MLTLEIGQGARVHLQTKLDSGTYSTSGVFTGFFRSIVLGPKGQLLKENNSTCPAKRSIFSLAVRISFDLPNTSRIRYV